VTSQPQAPAALPQRKEPPALTGRALEPVYTFQRREKSLAPIGIQNAIPRLSIPFSRHCTD